MKGKPHTTATKLKMSKGMRARWADPKYRSKWLKNNTSRKRFPVPDDKLEDYKVLMNKRGFKRAEVLKILGIE